MFDKSGTVTGLPQSTSVFPFTVLPQILHTWLSFTYHQCYIILATDCLHKTKHSCPFLALIKEQVHITVFIQNVVWFPTSCCWHFALELQNMTVHLHIVHWVWYLWHCCMLPSFFPCHTWRLLTLASLWLYACNIFDHVKSHYRGFASFPFCLQVFYIPPLLARTLHWKFSIVSHNSVQ